MEKRKRIIISPYSSKIPEVEDAVCTQNPKNYPHWKNLVKGLKKLGFYVIQIGVQGERKIEGVDEYLFNLKMKELKNLLDSVFSWISVDNFFPHFAHLYGKTGFAIYGPSDPEIWGYPENVNLVKSEEYQIKGKEAFLWWRWVRENREAFLEPKEILKIIENHLTA